VLNFSKILDSQNVFEKTDLDKIAENVIGDFDLLIKQKNAVITHDRLPVIEAIPLQINQLFYNLFSNAIKFSKPGVAPVIYITSRILAGAEINKFPVLDTSLTYCEIIFTDNGIGFDPQFAEQMFLIFQRLNSREHFEGTGVGLALCKKIVTIHHGFIYAQAKEEGSQFHVIIPVKQ
jgi:two-component system, chemotaxis family, CheB/CheR fusion protein